MFVSFKAFESFKHAMPSLASKGAADLRGLRQSADPENMIGRRLELTDRRLELYAWMRGGLGDARGDCGCGVGNGGGGGDVVVVACRHGC